jgi:hypothetical protein
VPKRNSGSIQIRTFRGPPEGFDPLKASPRELQRYGFPRRPNEVTEAHAASKWMEVFSKYSSFTHITPEIEDLPYRHGLIRRTQLETKGDVNAITSVNWSGYQLQIGSGDKFNKVIGQWTVPKAYSPNPGDGKTYWASIWLGLDGININEALQAGTDVNSDGSCYEWFQWLPDGPHMISNFPVNPGDVILMSLVVLTPTKAYMGINNLTSKILTSLTFTAPPYTTLIGNSAEAIVERFTLSGGGLASLARYGVVYFEGFLAYTDNGQDYSLRSATTVNMTADDAVTVISEAGLTGSVYGSCHYEGP